MERRSGATERRGASARFRRGASILPSLFTIGNLFLGFWSVILTFNGRFELAAPLLGWAIVLDVMDGRIARLTGTTSEFGAELDSLSDAISFGVAPALLAYAWALTSLGRVGWLAAFLFCVCGVLRLARFNVQRSVVDGRYFVGLPIPAAAAPVAALVYVFPHPPAERSWSLAVLTFLIVLAFLMVSTFRYHSFKNVDLRARRSYITVLGIALLLLLFASHPRWIFLSVTTAYWVSAPLAYVGSLLLRRRPSPPPPAPVAGEAV